MERGKDYILDEDIPGEQKDAFYKWAGCFTCEQVIVDGKERIAIYKHDYDIFLDSWHRTHKPPKIWD